MAASDCPLFPSLETEASSEKEIAQCLFGQVGVNFFSPIWQIAERTARPSGSGGQKRVCVENALPYKEDRDGRKIATPTEKSKANDPANDGEDFLP